MNLSSGLASATQHADPNGGLPKNIAAYSTSKTAVNAWTIFLAAELKDTPIKVNAGDPGWVKTDLGGPDARLSIDDSIPNVVRTLDGLRDAPGLHYVDYLGNTVPW